MAIFPVYADLIGFLNDADAAIETNSLIGGNATLHASYAAETTTIVVDPVTSPITYAVAGFVNGPAWILDGAISEVVQITNNTNGTLTLAAPGLQMAHSAGVNIASAGSAGNLAKALVDACRKADTYCRQGPAGVTGMTAGSPTTLAGAYSAGATSLVVANAANVYPGPLRLLDGPNSELVNVLTSTSGTNTLTLSGGGLTLAHASGTPVVNASGDRFLYALPRVETYTLATMTAHVDSDGTLVVRPYHFPVTQASSILLQLGTLTGNGVSFTGLVYPNDGRTIMLPYVSWTTTNVTNQWIPNPALRDPNLWIAMTYTAGPIPLAPSGVAQLALVSDDIKRAIYYYTMAILGFRSNPLGLAMTRQGDVQRSFELRGNQKNQSNLLIKEAEGALDPYRR